MRVGVRQLLHPGCDRVHLSASRTRKFDRVGEGCHNALAETVVGLYKTECVNIDGPFHTADELEAPHSRSAVSAAASQIDRAQDVALGHTPAQQAQGIFNASLQSRRQGKAPLSSGGLDMAP